ncbi:hypothetical protein, variant [Aphanomyces astaci]|uniref:Sulfhydryl oxidase n=1 Tax=Aphanomyces astaci TaxID=112090 RepID=W4GF35_APHAT|nr:hypothetical protein, variant [Aphanomyces astaci]ETV77553.1 hypothetical protein, variant [Aphanomyces astaci]|eukprot:XP_009832663.1 hypothetical protein, variant [Aphanomyces astaci]
MVAPVLPLLLLLLVSGLLPCEAAFWANSPPLFQNSQNVRSFTKDNFTAGVLMSDVVWVVDFYAPWCPHCKHFAPHFEGVADHYSDSTTVKYGAVDCTTEDKLCAEYEVMGYPQLRLFNLPAKGSKPLSMPFRHNGKKFDGVVTWVEEVFAEHNQTTGVDLPDFDLYKDIGHGGTAPPKKKHLRPDIATKQSSRDRRAAHLRDAGLALALSLETGMFLGSSVLAGTKYATAERWLQLLIARFPLAQNRQALATLLNRMQSQRSWALAEWKDLIATWKLDVFGTTYPRDLFSRQDMELCTTYTCGLWTLFHSLTVSQSSDALSRKDAIAVAFGIRDFVSNFFGCETCVMHFTGANPDSKLNAIGATGTPDQQLPLWLHAMHNSVNARTKHSQFPLPAVHRPIQCYLYTLSVHPLLCARIVRPATPPITPQATSPSSRILSKSTPCRNPRPNICLHMEKKAEWTKHPCCMCTASGRSKSVVSCSCLHL